MKTTQIAATTMAIAACAFLSGCGSGDSGATTSSTGGSAPGSSATASLSGNVTIDGSSTVFPIADAMGEDFMQANPGVKVVVNKSGTGSGMQKFGRGEIDIASASRPITQAEIDALKKTGAEFLEVPIAYDGVCVVVNPSNTFLKSATPDELRAAWSSTSKVQTWADWHAGWPAQKINFYGPTSIHGTYDYFTEAVDKKKSDIRKDYQANQDYNVVVQDVAGDKNGIGYMGMNYYVENKDKVKVVPIDAGKGPVTPTEQTVIDGTYTPLSRPLFLYVSTKAMARPEVKAFIEYALSDKGIGAVSESKYVPLPSDTIALVEKRVKAGTTGSLFVNVAPGTPVAKVLGKEDPAK